MCEELAPDVPLVSGWPKSIKSAVLNIISMAHYAIVAARGWAANSINARVRLNAENGRFRQEVELLCEEMRLKDARSIRIHPRHRLHYRPVERLVVEYHADRKHLPVSKLVAA